MRGFDISRFSGDIDFRMAHQDGNDFCIIRCGGTLEEKITYIDANYQKYAYEAKTTGMAIGAYYYTRATNAKEARTECDRIYRALKGTGLDIGLWIDAEETTALENLKTTYPVFKNLISTMCRCTVGITTFAAASNYLSGIDAPLWIANYTKNVYPIELDDRTVLKQIAGNVPAYGGLIDRVITL